ncbi:MAG: hypothetical protein AT707_01865, partial [Pyrobaculum sp. JCHS_4]
SYPLLVYIPTRLELGRFIDVVVVEHGSRSVLSLPYPLDINRAEKRLLRHLPGLGKEKMRAMLRGRPFMSIDDVKRKVGEGDYLKYVSV